MPPLTINKTIIFTLSLYKYSLALWTWDIFSIHNNIMQRICTYIYACIFVVVSNWAKTKPINKILKCVPFMNSTMNSQWKLSTVIVKYFTVEWIDKNLNKTEIWLDDCTYKILYLFPFKLFGKKRETTFLSLSFTAYISI